jgi:hypothetical protein
MKKMLALFLFILICSFSVFGASYPFENKEYVSDAGFRFSFIDNVFSYVKMEYHQDDSSAYRVILPATISGPYTIKMVSGFTVMEVTFPFSKRDIFVFYENDNILLYDTELRKTFIGTYRVRDEAMLYGIWTIKATSYLTETIEGKEIRYVPENLLNYDISQPWVEGAPGRGIGEMLTIGSKEKRYGRKNLVILNGFFSPEKPSLYLANSRVKSFLMRGYNEEGTLIYESIKELEDTPNFQVISSPVNLDIIELIITDVYPGTIYEDTAITGIFHDGLLHLRGN